MDWRPHRTGLLIIFFYFLFVADGTDSFLFGSDLSRSHLFQCLTQKVLKSLDCQSRKNQFCCQLLKRRSGRVQDGSRQFPDFATRKETESTSRQGTSRQFPNFPARDEILPREPEVPQRVPLNSDYDDIITKDSISGPIEEISSIKVDTSFSFDNDQSAKDEDNVIDVGEKIGSAVKLVDPQMCESLQVPCHAIANHPCCQTTQSADISKTRPEKMEKLFDFSRVNLMTSTLPPIAQTTSEESGNQDLPTETELCSKLKFSCRANPRHPCCHSSSSGFVPQDFSGLSERVNNLPVRTIFKPTTFKPRESLQAEDAEEEVEEESSNAQMCQTLSVPCHAIPNHPCCKETSLDSDEDKNVNNFEFSQVADNLQYSQKAIETTLAPESVDNDNSDEELLDQEICSKVSCQSQPNHHCCSDEFASNEESNEDDDYQEENFDFSRVAPMTHQTEMSTTTTTRAVTTPLKVDHRGKSPAQLNHDRACAALGLSCHEQPGHPCCRNDQYDLGAQQESVEEQFDFSRTAKKTTSSFTSAPTERPRPEMSHQEVETSLPVEKGKKETFLGGQRRAMKPVKEGEDQNSTQNLNEQTKENPTQSQTEQTKEEAAGGEGSLINEETIGEKGYDRVICAMLKVPCRFVSDHPCCDFEMPIDLVARARSMDGSADLKWRKLKTAGPQARSIDSLFTQDGTSSITQPILNKKIKYNHATSKSSVSIPQYHYDGGPETTSTILGVCWRLVYLRCPPPPMPSSDNSHQIAEELSRAEKVHPCCQLNRKPGEDTTGDSRISKWLSPSYNNDV